MCLRPQGSQNILLWIEQLLCGQVAVDVCLQLGSWTIVLPAAFRSPSVRRGWCPIDLRQPVGVIQKPLIIKKNISRLASKNLMNLGSWFVLGDNLSPKNNLRSISNSWYDGVVDYIRRAKPLLCCCLNAVDCETDNLSICSPCPAAHLHLNRDGIKGWLQECCCCCFQTKCTGHNVNVSDEKTFVPHCVVLKPLEKSNFIQDTSVFTYAPVTISAY